MSYPGIGKLELLIAVERETRMKPGDITVKWTSDDTAEREAQLQRAHAGWGRHVETDDERFDREAREEVDAMTRGWDWQV